LTAPTPAALRHIAGWLASLSRLTRHTGEPPAKDVLDDYARLLGRDFPPAAFSTDAMHAVLAGMEFWPSYDQLRARTADWWRDHKPASAPAAPGLERLSPIEQAWVAFYRRRVSELPDDPRERDPDEATRVQTPRGNLASLVRSHAPRAWAAICGQDRPPPRQAPTAEEIDAVTQTVAGLIRSPDAPARAAPRLARVSPDQLAALRQRTTP